MKFKFKFKFIFVIVIFSFLSYTMLSSDENKNGYETLYQNEFYMNEFVELSSHYTWINSINYKIIRKNAIKHDVPIELVCAVIQAESNGRNIRSSKNSNGTRDHGYMQINEIHLQSKYFNHINDFYDINKNIEFGCIYLKKCLTKATVNDIISYTDAIRMYNQGLSGERHKYKNYNYVLKVYRNFVVI